MGEHITILGDPSVTEVGPKKSNLGCMADGHSLRPFTFVDLMDRTCVTPYFMLEHVLTIALDFDGCQGVRTVCLDVQEPTVPDTYEVPAWAMVLCTNVLAIARQYDTIFG